MPLSIKVTGLDQVRAALAQFPQQIGRYLSAAGTEAGNEIVDSPGLSQYPAATAANEPPTPYYVRGQGTQYANSNAGNSERLGTQFYVNADDSYKTTIGNRASYAPYVVGDEQARAMDAIGWRRLIDVAADKIETIRGIFQGWIDKMIKDLGL